MPIIKIRKNRNATGKHDCWRLILNGNETLVRGAEVVACRVFTEAEVHPGGDIKYNICIDAAEIEIKDGVAYIK